MKDTLNASLACEAAAYIKRHAIAKPGDIVTTTWVGWKKPRKVRIYHVGAHLVCRYKKDAGDWIIGFALEYNAQRLRKDGTSAESHKDGGICLNNFTTDDGRQWDEAPEGTPQNNHEERGFNHVGLSWPRISERRIARELAAAQKETP